MTQIAVDVVCVVSKSNMAQCYNQDVLFLGTCEPIVACTHAFSLKDAIP